MDFTKTIADPNLLYLFNKCDQLILALYVEDLVLMGSSKKLIPWCKKKLASEFDLKEIDYMHCFLGLEVWRFGRAQERCSSNKEGVQFRF